jgi:hypothetical protein
MAYSAVGWPYYEERLHEHGTAGFENLWQRRASAKVRRLLVCTRVRNQESDWPQLRLPDALAERSHLINNRIAYRKQYGWDEKLDTPDGVMEYIQIMPPEIKMLIYKELIKIQVQRKHTEVCPAVLERAVNSRVHRMYCTDCLEHLAHLCLPIMAYTPKDIPRVKEDISQEDFRIIVRDTQIRRNAYYIATLEWERLLHPLQASVHPGVHGGRRVRNLSIRCDYIARVRDELMLYFNPNFSFFPYNWEHTDVDFQALVEFDD